MSEEELKKLSEDGSSIYDMVKIFGKGYSTIRYWLNKYNIKTLEGKSRLNNKSSEGKSEKICVCCNELKKKDEYYYSGGSRSVGYCKKCLNSYHHERVRKVKIKMIFYKGGKCERCNLSLEDSHYSVFDFHHLDPLLKDVNFRSIKFQKWEKIKNELDKCELLCSNCHRITHAEISGSFKMDDVVFRMNIKSGKSLWVKEIDNKKYCSCGKKIHSSAKECVKCSHLSQRKVERPLYEELIKEVDEIGYSAVGRKYGVSDNSIRKWIKMRY